MPFPIRMYFTAARRLIWSRLGDLRKAPRPSKAIQDCLTQTYGDGIRFTAEGGAFGSAGWIVRTDHELGFVYARGTQTRIRAFPFETLLETRIQRMPFYDYLHLVTKSERVSLRVFRSPRDKAQELFNEIQTVMSKRGAVPANPSPAAARPEAVSSSAEL